MSKNCLRDGVGGINWGGGRRENWGSAMVDGEIDATPLELFTFAYGIPYMYIGLFSAASP